MRIFVTGATGYIGSAVVSELLKAGHEVVGLARSDDSAARLEAAAAGAHRGTLEDLDALQSGAAASDGVIHTAFNNDFSNYQGVSEMDQRAIEAMGEALVGSDRPLVVASVTALLAPGRVGTEEDAPDDESASAVRVSSENTAIATAERGVRSSAVRLPPSVHGEGEHGLVPALISLAREKGISAYAGDGSNRWAAVHRLDAANLFRLALEGATAGSRLHAVSDEGVPFREIAEVIGRHLDVPTVSVPSEEVDEHFGSLSLFAPLDLPASSMSTREHLGWQPAHPGLIADLDHGHYFEHTRA